jgi:hypothetical protein
MYPQLPDKKPAGKDCERERQKPVGKHDGRFAVPTVCLAKNAELLERITVVKRREHNLSVNRT